ncbi:hypothetical protein [Staphylococcus shinii]|uniref:hypothetical protein n=1 Tax=Staphylococcus shinii TaxID=2912228 RepID=UPI003CED43CE
MVNIKNRDENIYISMTVDKLNELEGLNNKFIYQYNLNENWFDIMHSIDDILQKNDDLAEKIKTIIVDGLIANGIFNFSFYEDKEQIRANTIKFKNDKKHVFEAGTFKNNTKLITNRILSMRENKETIFDSENIELAM